MEQHLIQIIKFYQKTSRWLIPLLSLGLALIFAACAKEEPSPPSRNLFYEVQVVSVTDNQPVPIPTLVSGTTLNLSATDEPLFEPDLTASWSINWNCSSDHCEFQQCIGSAHGTVRDILDQRWLEIDRRIDWNEGCGKPNSWLSQVDRYSGQERYPGQDVLFHFWAGAKAGQAQEQITLIDGRKVNVWCTGPTKAEVGEDDGWMGLYDGEVCYDARTGMLVFMSYIKRWVFTGVFEGKSYERAYFGDSETYEQLLETTSAQLSFVEE
jgi:hypothetical protein